MRVVRLVLSFISMTLPITGVQADEVSMYFGTGPQPGSDQRNEINGFEYSFYTLERTSRQHIQIGISYSRMRTNANPLVELRTVSFYPQMSFYPSTTSRIRRHLPARARPFFFARALGAAYISRSSLGEREQAGNFSFHAQIGAGVGFEMPGGKQVVFSMSWRHLANANLASPNDGLDVPFTITAGIKY
jgi:hypothetical protein